MSIIVSFECCRFSPYHLVDIILQSPMLSIESRNSEKVRQKRLWLPREAFREYPSAPGVQVGREWNPRKHPEKTSILWFVEIMDLWISASWIKTFWNIFWTQSSWKSQLLMDFGQFFVALQFFWTQKTIEYDWITCLASILIMSWFLDLFSLELLRWLQRNFTLVSYSKSFGQNVRLSGCLLSVSTQACIILMNCYKYQAICYWCCSPCWCVAVVWMTSWLSRHNIVIIQLPLASFCRSPLQCGILASRRYGRCLIIQNTFHTFEIPDPQITYSSHNHQIIRMF